MEKKVLDSIYVPNEYKAELKKAEGGTVYMGISLGKYLFMNKEVMKKYLDFYEKHFSKIIFLIFDYPKKYNIMALDGVDETEATRRISIGGRELTNFFKKIIEDSKKADIKKYEYYMNEEYKKNLILLQKMYHKDKLFKEDINQIVLDFLRIPSNIKKRENISRNENESLSIAYNFLVDEVALICSCMNKEKKKACWSYPGLNVIVENIYNKKYDWSEKIILSPRCLIEAYPSEIMYHEINDKAGEIRT